MTFSSCCVFLAAVAIGAESRDASESVEVPSMLLRLIEQVDVPARESGVLASVQVVEGQIVEEGVVVAQIDSRRLGSLRSVPGSNLRLPEATPRIR